MSNLVLNNIEMPEKSNSDVSSQHYHGYDNVAQYFKPDLTSFMFSFTRDHEGC